MRYVACCSIIFHFLEGVDQDEADEATQEAEAGIERAFREGIEVALSPRRPSLRKMQHRIISGKNLMAQSTGREPQRYLVIYPPGE